MTQKSPMSQDSQDSSSKLSQVHITPVAIATIELTPPHAPREDTPEYRQSHHHLTIVLDMPCQICGVRNSTLKDPVQNPFGATALESHHYPIERSLVDACDPVKVGRKFPQVTDRASLNMFVDSEANLIVLCDVHHRSIQFGIHHLSTQDFFIQPFLIDGYRVVATQQDVAQLQAEDEKIEVTVGVTVTQGLTTTTTTTTLGMEEQTTPQGTTVTEMQVTTQTTQTTQAGSAAENAAQSAAQQDASITPTD